METDRHVRMVFALGLCVLGGYAMYLNKDVSAGVAIGAIAGVFTMGKSSAPPEGPNKEEVS